MRYLYQYPDFHGIEGDLLDAGPVAEVATTAEGASWGGLSFTEHPVPSARWLQTGGHQTLDPFVALGHAAAMTTRLRLLTYLAVAPYRNPSLLAKAAATVDKLSGGRFVLGLGTGYLRSEFRALGVDFEERNALFDEALDVLGQHWSGEVFSYSGRHFEIRDAIARPRPIQQPIPIWLGGNSRLTLRRVAERVQGWMPLVGPPELSATARTAHISSTAELAAMIAEVREMAGGRPIDVAVAYDDPSISSPEADVERHREAFAELESAGATWVVIAGSTTSGSATRDFLEAFGKTYIYS
jgi:probable F420-dependent oxidoreductase